MQITDIFDNGPKTRGVYLIKHQMTCSPIKKTKRMAHRTKSRCFFSVNNVLLGLLQLPVLASDYMLVLYWVMITNLILFSAVFN